MKKTYRYLYDNPTKDLLIKVINDLEEKGGKSLSKKLIRQHIFKLKWSKKEFPIIAKCNVKAAINYLQFLSEKGFNFDEIRIILADLKDWLQILGFKDELSFVILSTNTLPSIVHFKHAENLFYQHQISKEYRKNYNLDLIVLYAIRLSVEKRVLGFLGIDYVTVNNRPVGLSKLLDISKGLKNIEFNEEIDWVEIKLIIEWLNHHMHRHIRPHPWTIYQAFECLNILLKPGIYLKDGREIHSFYSASVVHDEEQLKKEIEDKLKLTLSDPIIKWTSEKERLIYKNG